MSDEQDAREAEARAQLQRSIGGWWPRGWPARIIVGGTAGGLVTLVVLAVLVLVDQLR